MQAKGQICPLFSQIFKIRICSIYSFEYEKSVFISWNCTSRLDNFVFVFHEFIQFKEHIIRKENFPRKIRLMLIFIQRYRFWENHTHTHIRLYTNTPLHPRTHPQTHPPHTQNMFLPFSCQNFIKYIHIYFYRRCCAFSLLWVFAEL